MKRNITAMLLCLALALTVLFALLQQANAATAQETGNAILEEALAMEGKFPTDGTDYPARCPHCNTNVTWKALSTKLSASVQDSGHYYLQGDTKNSAYQTFTQINGNICLHMNGFNFSAGYARGTFIFSGRTLTIMGSGTFSSPAKSGSGGVVYSNGGTVNIYGTTIKTDANNGEPALSLYSSGTRMNLWGATLDTGTNPLISTNGTVNLYNCTAISGKAVEQDDPKGGNGSTAELNLYDSTVPGVKSEIGTVTVSGATKITGTGLALKEGAIIDPTNLTEGASIAIANEGVFTTAGMSNYAKYFTSATTGLKMIAKLDGSLANLGAAEYGYEVTARAQAMVGEFPTDGTSTYVAGCPACGKTNVTWKPLTAKPGNAGADFENNGHYFLPKDLSLGGQVFLFDRETTLCVHLNGMTMTDTSYRFVMVANSSTFNLMGSGVLTCNTKGNRGSVYTNNGTANIYGVTVKNTTTVADTYGNAAIALYNTNDVVNVWSSTLEGSTVSPVILANGAVNLYNTTATGIAAQIGGYSGRPDSNAALNLYDSSVTGVDQKTGNITVSGAAKITGTGLSLLAGKTINPSKLTSGAEIIIADECTITGSGMAAYAGYFKAAKAGQEITVLSDGTLQCWIPKALLVAADGTEAMADDLLTDWATGNYAYVKLYGEDALALSGQEIKVDLNGFDLTVEGTGTVSVFDTANDTYNASACGVITNLGEVTFAKSIVAPNGRTYVAVEDDNLVTAHRVELKLSTVSLRTSAAGLYYKAKYECDSILAGKVKAYGVVVSVNNMPGADFKTEPVTGNKNAWTAATAPFKSGVVATSGSLFGILKDERTATENDQRGRIPIYANVYIDLGNGPVVGDTKNAGLMKSDTGFTGVALSLYDVMAKIDEIYSKYPVASQKQVDDFYAKWNGKGTETWRFTNIGNTTIPTDEFDNSDIELKFAEGTTNAECPVCKKQVTWTPISDETKYYSINGHYYLTKDITYTGDGAGAGFIYNGTKDTTLCLHLNGKNITATKVRAFFGSSGRLNVMGKGVVSGYNSGETGAALQLNNSTLTNGVYIYGGTWRKASSATKAAVLGVHAQGGVLNVYSGATIEASGDMAIMVRTPESARNAQLGLFGCTIKGDVILRGGDPAKGYTSTAEFLDCKIDGDVQVAKNNTVYISGAPVIKSVTLAENVLLTTKVLTEGTNIGITNSGIFTAVSGSVKNYTGYFHGLNSADVITVRDNALHCGPDYTSNLKFAEGTTDAMCPACSKVVTWTELTAKDTHQDLKGHYYLEKDQTFAKTGSAFFSNGSKGTTLCVHLNGHNLTATQTRAVHGSSGRTNIMGTGVVTGYQKTADYAAAVQINNMTETQSVHLYSGTYKKTSNSNAGAASVGISDVGGNLFIYEDAIIENTGNTAIVVRTPINTANSVLGLYGCTVNGNVKLMGADPTQNSNTCAVEFKDCTVNGTVDVAGYNDVTLSGAPKIQLLDMEATALLTLNNLKDGANITVLNEGVFTKPHASAAAWAGYFHTANSNDLIDVKENALHYKVNYTSKLYLDNEGKAYCPVCKETVQWTAISSGETKVEAENGKHYYLTKDVVYEGVYDGNIAFFNAPSVSGAKTCLHLNGNNITSTKCHGIYGGYGVLNVMGEGIVTGYSSKDIRNAAVQINNRVKTNALNLYSGTYRKSANSVAAAGVVGIEDNGSRIRIYEDANISNPSGSAITVGTSYINSNLEIYGATIVGDITVAAPSKTNGDYKAIVLFKNVTVDGEVTVAAGNEVTLDGRTKINKLTLPAGQTVTFTNMLEGSDITVSADGIFTPAMDKADEWLNYITCADAGDWIIVRNKQFLQEVKKVISAATDSDKTALLNTYAGATLRYGEMHNHTNSGPYLDDGTGFSPSTGADGKKSLDVWIAEMDRLKMDFAFIVDHGMSIHMYHENFRPDYFIGGTEPGTTITDSNASRAKPHYNMLFAYPNQLESIFFKWESKYEPIKWNKENYPTALTPSEDGYRVKYPSFTTEEFKQLAQDVYDAGGLLVQVHPKYSGYIVSDDPLDYYFADYTGIEISTGNGTGYRMMYSANNKAYNLWVDLLELGKKVWATAGSDGHSFPDYSGLTAMYTVNDHKDDYMAGVRVGNMAPGWVGIRMNVNGTAMGGETDFTGKRLQFSVGDMYNAGEKDYCNTPAVYVPGHSYRVDLYDEGGILMSAPIDPIGMNYFAIDCDADAKFYRVVVWDETDNERVGVSNPIWNTAG